MLSQNYNYNSWFNRNPGQKSVSFTGVWGKDDRKDIYQETNAQILRNSLTVAAICEKDAVIPRNDGTVELDVENFGEKYNLSPTERFYNQPKVKGPMCTCFLVEKDKIVTAAHFIYGKRLSNFYIAFGFKMLGFSTPSTRLPVDNIYMGVKLIDIAYNRKNHGVDWAIVQLDRNVSRFPLAKLSNNDIDPQESVYTIGHPCGLPLKCASGATISEVERKYFSANLDVFSGNSGSPVFSAETHEVIGMVVHGDKDFCFVEDKQNSSRYWKAITYDENNRDLKKPGNTRASEFISLIKMA